MARAGKLRCLRLIRNRCFFSCFTWHGKAQAAPSVCPLLADAGKMEAVIEKECSALGGLFQTIISDMKKDPEVACVFTMSAAYHLQSCNHRPPGELSSLGRFHKQSRKATVPASELQEKAGKRQIGGSDVVTSFWAAGGSEHLESLATLRAQAVCFAAERVRVRP
ncbi:uncharacterized protein [Manis javanica]|uniref:uncharacterized protein isoform X2 n=1 Tax=Manis javanica TaxID=9974 RepID=UPI003C6D2B45